MIRGLGFRVEGVGSGVGFRTFWGYLGVILGQLGIRWKLLFRVKALEIRIQEGRLRE